MRALTTKTETTGAGGMPPGFDICVLGKIELHAGRLDGFGLHVLLSSRLSAMLSAEARETGKTPGEILGYLLDLSLYEKR